MEKNSNADEWWHDGVGGARAYINAEFKGGVFVDRDTGLPVSLSDGARVRMQISSVTLPSDATKRHEKEESVKLIEKGSELYFTLKIPGEGEREYKVILSEDLTIHRKGNRTGRLSFVPCEVWDVQNNKLVTRADSLNEAYTRTSAMVRPDARTHTANVFRVFFYNKTTLEDLRPF